MTTLNKKAFKGLPVSIKIRKPRYYYQDALDVYNENEERSFTLTKFEGIDYTFENGYIWFEGKKLWNGELSPSMGGFLAPYVKGKKYLSTKKGLAYDIVGSLTIQNNVVSGFSKGNYINMPFINCGTNSWEVNFKVTTSANDLTKESPFISCNVDQRGFRIGTAGTTKGRWQLLVSSGSSWINTSAHSGSHIVLADTTYWIKAGFDASINTYYLKYSFNGIDYINDVSYVSYTKIGSYQQQIGYIDIGDSPWHGSIDLNECSISVNGVEVWGKNAKYLAEEVGILEEKANPSVATTYNAFANGDVVLLSQSDQDKEGYAWAGEVVIPSFEPSPIFLTDFTQTGSISLDDKGKASSFSETTWIETPEIITNATSENYVLVARVTTGGDTGSRNIFWKPASPDYGCGTTGYSWRFWRGSQYSGGSIELNTTYWVVVKQTPSQTTLYYTKDDGTYNSIDELPLGLIGKDDAWLKGAECPYTVFEVPVVRIGNGYGTLQEYWTGNIDLVNTGIFKEVSGFFTSYEKIWQALEKII